MNDSCKSISSLSVIPPWCRRERIQLSDPMSRKQSSNHKAERINKTMMKFNSVPWKCEIQSRADPTSAICSQWIYALPAASEHAPDEKMNVLLSKLLSDPLVSGMSKKFQSYDKYKSTEPRLFREDEQRLTRRCQHSSTENMKLAAASNTPRFISEKSQNLKHTLGFNGFIEDTRQPHASHIHLLSDGEARKATPAKMMVGPLDHHRFDMYGNFRLVEKEGIVSCVVCVMALCELVRVSSIVLCDSSFVKYRGGLQAAALQMD
ncbi:hypothetical protein DNTS_033802 [Danionella cerebrum]|uniref:Uncharacterized protein n=1 Tax=Danionella cerebrum TaxID=2873325 RepID=A0A553ML58_9TELE|nr:hypothetical protein DNTS_033802 [Danionella translucida]